jgi:Na+/H+-dicarboxylate symporter
MLAAYTEKRRLAMSLSTLILLAMMAGIILGATLGYALPGMELLGQAFVMLLQMTAIPYVAISLIYGIGMLTKTQGRQLLIKGIAVFLLLFACVVVIVLLSSLGFPDWQAASFYDPGILLPVEQSSLLFLFISANPFSAFSEGRVPAVVTFCTLLGVGVMAVRHRRLSLHVLRHIQQALAHANGYVMKLAPVGVFAVAQKAAGTLDPEELDGLLVYIVSAGVVTMVVAMVLLPGLVAIMTPWRIKHVFKASRSALLTAFATGQLFVVLPVIAERVKQLIDETFEDKEVASHIPEVVVPISFSLPLGGKLLALLFVLFAAWFNGKAIPLSDYPLLVLSGLIQLFGSIFVATPNLLAQFDLSPALVDLHVLSENLIVGRLGAMLSAMFCTVLAMMVACAVAGKLRLTPYRLMRFAVIVPALTALLLFGISKAFEAISHQYQGYEKFIQRELILPTAPFTVLAEPQPDSGVQYAELPTLQRIKARGLLRMGYYRDALPYAFNNADGKLVGLDIELIHLLARDLGVRVEFVKVFHHQTGPLLESGYLDIAAGIPFIPENIHQYTLTMPYSQDVVAVVTRRERRKEFRHWQQIVERDDLVVGVPEALFYREPLQRYFKRLRVEELSSPRLFFRDQGQRMDAMIFGAAGASAWSLIYPEYSVVMPQPRGSAFPIAFPIARHDYEFELFMRHWLSAKQANGVIDRLFRYWIEGKAVKFTVMAPGEAVGESAR